MNENFVLLLCFSFFSIFVSFVVQNVSFLLGRIYYCCCSFWDLFCLLSVLLLFVTAPNKEKVCALYLSLCAFCCASTGKLKKWKQIFWKTEVDFFGVKIYFIYCNNILTLKNYIWIHDNEFKLNTRETLSIKNNIW